MADKPISQLKENNGMTLTVHFAPGANTDWLDKIHFEETTITRSAAHWQFFVSPGYDPRIELFEAAASHHCPIIELRTEENQLEEVFHKLTQSTK